MTKTPPQSPEAAEDRRRWSRRPESRPAEILTAAFDVFALSSDSEGLPLSLAEAMSAELPIVSTAVGGVPKVVVEGETGFLTPAGDEEKLREKIRTLVEDPALRERFGKRAREIALARYSADRMTDDYLALYRGR